MKEQLILKANKLGFVSKFFNDKPYKYSNKEDLRYYLWLSELSLWLQSEYQVHVFPILLALMFPEQGWGFEIVFKGENYDEYTEYHNQEQALEAGIFESLKLIENI